MTRRHGAGISSKCIQCYRNGLQSLPCIEDLILWRFAICGLGGGLTTSVLVLESTTILQSEDRVMSLIYRGCRYDAPVSSVHSHAGPLGGYYRGRPWHRRVVASIPEQAVMELQYRGIAYSTNRAGQVMPSKMPARRPAAPTWAMQARASHAKVTESAMRHHDALVGRLEKRIAIARDQGNAELVKILESERQQLA